MREPRLVVVTGPTATGKTSAAIALARRFGGELIGADSVQVYRGFDVGSGKATQAELEGIAHHAIDVRDPAEAMDASEYAALADAAIADVAGRGRVPIVVGGSGLWLRALMRGLIELPQSDPSLRAGLYAEIEAEGAPALHARLAQLDPIAAARIHPNDALRITRALEIHAQTGRPAGALREAHAQGQPRHQAWLAVLDLPRDEHDRAIEARIDSMLERGFLDEVRALVARAPGARGLGAVGYREMAMAVRGECTLAEARLRAIKATRVYARRQRTWCRSELDVSVRTRADDLIGGAHDEAIRAWLSAGAR